MSHNLPYLSQPGTPSSEGTPWAKLRARGSSFVFGALLTLGAFSVGRFARPEEAPSLRAELTEQAPPLPEVESVRAETVTPARANVATAPLSNAAPVHEGAPPILRPSDLPLEEKKSVRSRTSKTSSRVATRLRGCDAT